MKNKWTAGETLAPLDRFMHNEDWQASIDYNAGLPDTWFSKIMICGETREEAETLRDVILEHLRHGEY